MSHQLSETPRSSLTTRRIALACIALGIMASEVFGQVTVSLSDGKVIHADNVGSKTNHDFLQLQLQTRRIRMSRRISWERIVLVRIRGQEVSKSEVVSTYRGVDSSIHPVVLRTLATLQSEQNDKQQPPKKTGDLPPVPRKDDPFLPPKKTEEKQNQSGDGRVEILAPPKTDGPNYEEGASCVIPRPAVPHAVDSCQSCTTCQSCEPRCAPEVVVPFYPRLPVPRTVGLPIEYYDVGIQDDPLEAYADLLERSYPNCVHLYEAGYALNLMRAARADQIFRAFDKQPENLPPRPPANDQIPNGDDRVQRIEVTARPISARGKADFDSLEVFLTAFNSVGEPASIRGQVYLTLWGQRAQYYRSNPTEFAATRGDIKGLGRTKRIAEWARFVDSLGDLRPTRLVVRFPQPYPDHDSRIGSFGQLHVKLAAAGDGVFEATQQDVALRHVSRLRAQQQFDTGTTFFPREGTSGSRRRQGYFYDGTSSYLRPRGGVFTVKP